MYNNRFAGWMESIMNKFDAHFHIIDPRFPLYENNGYLPPTFTTQMYQEAIKPFNIQGGAIVSGSFQEFDQEYLLQALNALGANYVGVVNLQHNASDETIISLYEQRVRGVRFNLVHSGSESVTHLVELAQRIYDLCGMHAELCVKGPQVEAYFDIFMQLPKFSIDHLGLSHSASEFKLLLKLVERGANVKASGFMRAHFDVNDVLQTIYAINPQALMFGTDLPGTRASRLFDESDVNMIQNNFSAAEQDNIFSLNAIHFYKMV